MFGFERVYVHVMEISVTLPLMKTRQTLSHESSIACYGNPDIFSYSIVVSGILVQNLTGLAFGSTGKMVHN